MYNRRQLLTRLGATAATAVGVGILPRWARAQAANDQVVLAVFLRGAADAASIVFPLPSTRPSAARLKYEAWRHGQTRINSSARAMGFGLGLHPAFAPLRAAINAGHLTFIPGVANAVMNRSHFRAMDLIESGSGDEMPRADGVLARAWTALQGGTPAPGLGAVALNATLPYSLLRRVAPAVTAPSFASFGGLPSRQFTADVDASLTRRLARLYVPASGTCAAANLYCASGQQASTTVDALGSLIDASTLDGNLGHDLVDVLARDTERQIKLMTIDIGGWDTHNDQGDERGGGLKEKLDGLVGLMSSIYQHANATGVMSRLTVMVMSEFGRTTFENGTAGTDHGYGSMAMVMSHGVAGPIVGGDAWFPSSGSGAFYDAAENLNVLPRAMEHRQVYAEVLSRKLGLTDLSAVLPGFTPSAGRIFA